MSDRIIFRPKLLSTLTGYSWTHFFKDLFAGIVVGIVALPLAIAFGIASGVAPEKGIITAVIAGFLISFLGGSRVQIGGPTGAFIVIVYGIIADYGYGQLLIATMIAGILLVLMGVCRLGNWIKFVPTSVVVGFTSGIALVIFSSQMRDFFGLQLESVPAHFLAQWESYFFHMGSINPWAVLISSLTILIIFSFQEFLPRIPSSFFGLVFATAVAVIFKLPIETIGSRFGEVSGAIPIPVMPEIHLATIRHLMIPAFTIALLGAIESLLSAIVSDGMIGGKHRSNTELIAQGIANIAAPFFGGIPATGAIARTTVNVKSGGRTPIAGMVHAVTLLIIMLFLMPLAKMIPMAVLAGILVVVCYHMSEWREFRAMLSAPKSDVTIMVTTFILTVVFDLTVAIQMGMVMAAFLFMNRMSEVSDLKMIGKEEGNIDEYYSRDGALSKLEIPKDIIIFEISGALFFGAAAKFDRILHTKIQGKKAIILRMNNVFVLDASGLRVLHKVWKNAKKLGVEIYFAELQEDCKEVLYNSVFSKEFEKDHFFDTIAAALEFVKKKS